VPEIVSGAHQKPQHGRTRNLRAALAAAAAAASFLGVPARDARAQILEKYLPAQVLGTDSFIQRPPLPRDNQRENPRQSG
jgi:hypothetical protein